jgi:hypothetical protein
VNPLGATSEDRVSLSLALAAERHYRHADGARAYGMTGRWRIALGALVFTGCATAATPAPAPKPPAKEEPQGDLPIPPEMRAEIQKVEAIGRQLYVLDKVSAVATDVLMERVPDLRNAGVAGYIPMQEADDDGRPKDSFLVSFFTRQEPPQVAYEVHVRPDARPDFEAFQPPKPASDSLAMLVRARQAAIAALPPVHQPMNPVLLPASANGEKGILVYMIAGTTRPGIVVFGQHFRVLIPENSQTPTYVMPLSKTALEMPARGGPAGAKTEGLAVTHLVTDWPLETHVLVSLQWHLPVYVGTHRGIWRVDGDKIALIRDRPPKGL